MLTYAFIDRVPAQTVTDNWKQNKHSLNYEL